MRFILSSVLCAGIVAAVGCSDRGKPAIKEATAEDIRQQKEVESRVKAEESEMHKKQPKEKTQEQTVDEAERNRRR